MKYKKNERRFSLYDQKRIALIVQERKRKYEGEKKIPEINKAIWDNIRKKWEKPFTKTKYLR